MTKFHSTHEEKRLFGLTPASFGTFIIRRRVDNSPVTPTRGERKKGQETYGIVLKRTQW